MIRTVTILLLCAVGFYASVFMARKAALAARGGLSEPSVVQTPRARAFGGLPNSWFGVVFYLAVAGAAPFLGACSVWLAVFVASLAAAAFSIYLAYSLLFVTRMACKFCWTSHAINWILAALVALSRPAC